MYRRLSQNMYNVDTLLSSQGHSSAAQLVFLQSALYSNINIDLKRWIWTGASINRDLDCAYLLGKYPQKLDNNLSYAWIQV